MSEEENPTMTTSKFASGFKAPTVDKVLPNQGNVRSVPPGTKVVDFSSMTEEKAYFNENIIARPVMMPDILDFKTIHTEYAYRWVQFKAMNGKRYSDAKFMGFVDATADDISMVNSQAHTVDGIIVGDLKLMKIHKEIYYGMLKGNVERAVSISKRPGIASAAKEVMNIHGIVGGPRAQDRLNLFVPSQEVIDAKIEGREISV